MPVVLEKVRALFKESPPSLDAISWACLGNKYHITEWLEKGLKHILKRPMRALSVADLNYLHEYGLGRPIWLYKEWIMEIRCEAAFTIPPYVYDVGCTKEKQCRTAWEWIWVDGVRLRLTHPFQPSGGWDVLFLLRRACNQFSTFMCEDCLTYTVSRLSNTNHLPSEDLCFEHLSMNIQSKW